MAKNRFDTLYPDCMRSAEDFTAALQDISHYLQTVDYSQSTPPEVIHIIIDLFEFLRTGFNYNYSMRVCKKYGYDKDIMDWYEDAAKAFLTQPACAAWALLAISAYDIDPNDESVKPSTQLLEINPDMFYNETVPMLRQFAINACQISDLEWIPPDFSKPFGYHYKEFFTTRDDFDINLFLNALLVIWSKQHTEEVEQAKYNIKKIYQEHAERQRIRQEVHFEHWLAAFGIEENNVAS